jgi:hypothetical protein
MTFQEIAFKMTFEVADSLKALEGLKNQIRDGIGDAYTAAAKAQAKYGQELEKLAQQQAKTAQQNVKTLQEESKLRQQLGKEAEQNAKRVADADKRAEAERKKAAQETANFKKAVDAELRKAAIGDADKLIELERKKAALAKEGAEKNSKEVRAVLEEEARLKEAMYKREAEMVEALYKAKLATVAEGSDEWVKLEQERLDRILAAEKKGASEAEKARKAEEGPKGRNFDEVAENFATLTDSLTSGNIAGAAAGIGQMFGDMGGKVGGVIGVVADQVIGFISTLGDLANAAVETDEKWKAFSLTFNDTDLSAQSIKNIQVELQALSRPAGVSEQAIAELGATVAGFEKSDKIAETAGAILDLEAASGGMDISAITAGVSQFGTALGDGALAADLFATAQQTASAAGTTMSQTMTGVTKTFVGAQLAIKDTAKAGKESAAVFAGLTKTGVSTTRGVSIGRDAFAALGKTVSDPKLLYALTKQLPEGVSAVDAGLVKGDVSVTKFAKTLASMGDAGLQVASSLGGGASTAVQLLIKGAQSGSINLDKLTSSFDNAAGAAGRYATLLTPASKVQNELADQRAADAMTNLGRTFSSLADSGAGLFNTLLDGLVSVGGPIADMFIDYRVEAERAMQAVDQNIATLEGFGALVGGLNAGDPSQFLADVNSQMEQISNVGGPGAAAQIEKINANAQLTDAEKMESISRVLTQIEQSQAAATIQQLNDAIELSNQAIEQAADDANDWWGAFIDGASAAVDIVGGVLTNDVDQLNKGLADFEQAGVSGLTTLAEQANYTANKVEKLQAAYDLAPEGSQKQLDIAQQLTTEWDRQLQIENTRTTIVSETVNQITSQLDALEAVAEARGQEFDRAQQLQILMQGTATEEARRLGIMEDVSEQTQQILDGTANTLAVSTQQTGADNQQLQIANEKVDAANREVEAKQALLGTAEQELTIANERVAAAQAALEALEQQGTAAVSVAEAEEAGIAAAEEKVRLAREAMESGDDDGSKLDIAQQLTTEWLDAEFMLATLRADNTLAAEKGREILAEQVVTQEQIAAAQAELTAATEAHATAQEGVASATDEVAKAQEAVVTAMAAQTLAESDLSNQVSNRAEFLKTIGVETESQTKEQLTQLKAASVAQQQLIDEVNAQIAGIDAVIQGRVTEAQAIEDVARRQERVNQLVADQQRASETGETTVTAELPELSATSTIEDFKAFKAGLQSTRDSLQDQKNAIDKTISGLEDEGATRVAKTDERGEAEDRAVTAIEKKTKAEDKSADAARKAAETSARASATQSKNASKAASEAEKARKKAIEDEKKRNEELRKALVQAVQAAQAQFNQLFQKAADQSAAAAQRLGRAMDELTFITEATTTQEQARAQAEETEEQRKSRLQAAVSAAEEKLSDANVAQNLAVNEANRQGIDSFRVLGNVTYDLSLELRNLKRNLQRGLQPGAAQRSVAREVETIFQTIIPTLNQNARRAMEDATQGIRDALDLSSIEALLNAMKEGTIPRDKLADLITALSTFSASASAQFRSLSAPVQTARGAVGVAGDELDAAKRALNEPLETAVDAVDKIGQQLAAGLGAANALLEIGALAENKFVGVGESMGRIVRLISEGKTDGAFSGILSALGTDLKGALSTLVDLRKQFTAVQTAAAAEIEGYDKQIADLQLGAVGLTGELKKEKQAEIDLILARKKALEEQQKAVEFVLDKATMEARFAQEALADGYAKALAETEQAVGEAQSNITQAMADEEQKRIDKLKQSESERVRIQIDSEREVIEERIKARQMELEDLQRKLEEQNAMQDTGAAQTAEQIRAGEEELAGLQNTLADLDTTTPFRLGEAAIADMNKAAENITKVMGGVDTATEFIGAMREAGDALDVVDAGADLAQKIGSVLMTAPPPWNIAGAVLAGAGLIAKAVTGIIRLFQSKELTQKEQAENEISRQERINALYDKRKELLEKTIALGDVTVDQAFEQLRVQKSLMAAKSAELGMSGELTEMEAERLAMTIERNAQELQGMGDRLAEAQKLLDIGDRSEMRDFLESQGVDVGVNSKKAMEEFIDGLEAEIMLLEQDTENLEAVMEMQQTILDLEKAVIDERLQLNDLRIKLGADERKVLGENEKMMREQLEDQLELLIFSSQKLKAIAKQFGAVDSKGVNSKLSEMTPEELKDFLAALAEMPDSQLSGPIIEMVDQWIAAGDAVAAFNGDLSETEGLFDRLKTRLGLLRDLGRITDQEHQDQLLTLLEERLAFLEAEEQSLIDQGASAGELLDNELARLGIEKEIRDLLAGENGELMKTDKILTKIVSDRQKLLASFRQMGTGTLSATQQAQLKAATDAAVARMRETGATEDEIDAFLASLPQYEQGGFIPTGGPKMLHPGEFVLPAPIVSQIGKDELERFLSNSPSNLMNSIAARMLSRQSNTGMSGPIIGEVNITVTVQGSVTDAGAKAMGQGIGSSLATQLNKLIQEGNVRVSRG